MIYAILKLEMLYASAEIAIILHVFATTLYDQSYHFNRDQ